MEHLNGRDVTSVSLTTGGGLAEGGVVRGRFTIRCVRGDEELWSDTADNLIVNQGKNALLDAGLAGSAWTAAYYLSLITAGAAIATSTYAVPTVTEVAAGVLANRIALGWTVAANGAKASTTTSCAIVGSATITGAMVVSGGSGVTTPGNTAATGGVLFSAGTFTGGNKIVSSGDTLNVSYSVSV